MKIYTGTGDKGKTSTYDGRRVYKNSIRVESYGTIDELNSNLGLLKNYIDDLEIKEIVEGIQRKLFNVAGELATVDSSKFPEKINSDDIEYLESVIDKYIDIMGRDQAFQFIIPGSNIESGYFHVSRTICRRAERRILDLNGQLLEEKSTPISEDLLKYINRLSDTLYTLGRYRETKRTLVNFKNS